MERTQRWSSLFRGLPYELLTKDVLDWIQSDDADRLIEFLRSRCQEAFDEEHAFYEQDAGTRHRLKIQLETLSADETAWIEWYDDQLAQRRKRTQLLVRCLRAANDIIRE